jgi:hypothetical protein
MTLLRQPLSGSRFGRSWCGGQVVCAVGASVISPSDGTERFSSCGARLLDLAGQCCGLGSSPSDLFGLLPGRALSARHSDGAGSAGCLQGCRTPGAPAPERGAAPPDQPGCTLIVGAGAEAPAKMARFPGQRKAGFRARHYAHKERAGRRIRWSCHVQAVFIHAWIWCAAGRAAVRNLDGTPS